MINTLVDINDKKYLLIPAYNSNNVLSEMVRRIEGGQATAEPIQVFSLKSVPSPDAPDECESFDRLEYSFLCRNTKGGAYHPHINVEPRDIDVRLQTILNSLPYTNIDGLLIDNGKAILLDKDAVDKIIAQHS